MIVEFQQLGKRAALGGIEQVHLEPAMVRIYNVDTLKRGGLP